MNPFLLLAQETTPVIASDTPTWLAILAIVVSTAAYVVKRWADKKLVAAEERTAVSENVNGKLQLKLMEALAAHAPPILFVDDDADDYELFRLLLKKTGCENPVVWMPTGEDAHWYMKQNQVVFALVDLNMPHSGKLFLSNIKADSETSEVDIIMMSGILTEDISLYQSGAIGFLTKPINLEDLLKILSVHGCVWRMCHEPC